MSNLRKIGNKLFDKKTELKSHAVHLSLVDDAKKTKGDFVSIAENEADYFGLIAKAESEAFKVVGEYKQLLKEIETITPKLESAIDEIGINRNNFQVLDDLNSLKSETKERISTISDNLNKLKSINP